MRVAALLVLIAALAALWLRTMAARERAVRACREACRAEHVQLLDETVCLRAVRLRRGGARLAIERVYGFEYSVEGHERRTATVVVSGNHPAQVIWHRPVT